MRFHEPLLLPFATIAAGVAIARYQSFPLAHVVPAIAACGFLAFFAHRIHSGLLCLTASLIALTFAGIAVVAVHVAPRAPALSVPDNTQAIFTGCVVDPALLAADRERFTVELAPGARAQVSLFAREGERFPALPYGTNVEFQGKVRTPHNFNNPGEFDSVHFLARQTFTGALRPMRRRSACFRAFAAIASRV